MPTLASMKTAFEAITGEVRLDIKNQENLDSWPIRRVSIFVVMGNGYRWQILVVCRAISALES